MKKFQVWAWNTDFGPHHSNDLEQDQFDTPEEANACARLRVWQSNYGVGTAIVKETTLKEPNRAVTRTIASFAQRKDGTIFLIDADESYRSAFQAIDLATALKDARIRAIEAEYGDVANEDGWESCKTLDGQDALLCTTLGGEQVSIVFHDKQDRPFARSAAQERSERQA